MAWVKGKLSELGLSPGQAEDLFEKYHSRVPFVKEMIERTMKKASDVGHVRTLLGRKCRFDCGSLHDTESTDHCPGTKQNESMENKYAEPLLTKL